MKKFLLFTVATLLATGSAMAITEEDVTPNAYDFSKMTAGTKIHYAASAAGANIGAPCTAFVDANWTDENGLLAAAGAAANITEWYPALQAGSSIVDLGGTVGKVMCVNGVNSTLSAKLKELYGADVNIPSCTTALNWFNFNWFSDPKNTPTGTAAAPNIRVRIVFNIYENTLTEAATMINKAYTVNNQGNILPAADNTAEKIGVTSGEFMKCYDDGTPEEDAEGNYIWDPTQWMTYEFDTWVPMDEEATQTWPLRIKMEMAQGELANGALLIKEIKFLKVTDNAAPILNTRSKTMKTLTVNPPSTTGVETVATNTVANYSVNGQEVTFGEAGAVYTATGALVETVQAGETVTLAKGFYVAKVGNKGAKFVIK